MVPVISCTCLFMLQLLYHYNYVYILVINIAKLLDTTFPTTRADITPLTEESTSIRKTRSLSIYNSDSVGWNRKVWTWTCNFCLFSYLKLCCLLKLCNRLKVITKQFVVMPQELSIRWLQLKLNKNWNWWRGTINFVNLLLCS